MGYCNVSAGGLSHWEVAFSFELALEVFVSLLEEVSVLVSVSLGLGSGCLTAVVSVVALG